MTTIHAQSERLTDVRDRRAQRTVGYPATYAIYRPLSPDATKRRVCVSREPSVPVEPSLIDYEPTRAYRQFGLGKVASVRSEDLGATLAGSTSAEDQPVAPGSRGHGDEFETRPPKW